MTDDYVPITIKGKTYWFEKKGKSRTLSYLHKGFEMGEEGALLNEPASYLKRSNPQNAGDLAIFLTRNGIVAAKKLEERRVDDAGNELQPVLGVPEILFAGDLLEVTDKRLRQGVITRRIEGKTFHELLMIEEDNENGRITCKRKTFLPRWVVTSTYRDGLQTIQGMNERKMVQFDFAILSFPVGCTATKRSCRPS